MGEYSGRNSFRCWVGVGTGHRFYNSGVPPAQKDTQWFCPIILDDLFIDITELVVDFFIIHQIWNGGRLTLQFKTVFRVSKETGTWLYSGFSAES